MVLWNKAHPVYRDRAEERRRTVGSDAYTTAHRPAMHTQAVVLESTAPPPRMPVSTVVRPVVRPMEMMAPDAVIPGYSRGQEKKVEAPSIGQMLLAKDGWLQKHKEENVSVVGQTSSNHGGLGYQSMILEGDNFLKKWRVCSQTRTHRIEIHTNTFTRLYEPRLITSCWLCWPCWPCCPCKASQRSPFQSLLKARRYEKYPQSR